MVELLHKAIEWQALLESGKTASQAEIARQEGITRARVTQRMGTLTSPRKAGKRSSPFPTPSTVPP